RLAVGSGGAVLPRWLSLRIASVSAQCAHRQAGLFEGALPPVSQHCWGSRWAGGLSGWQVGPVAERTESDRLRLPGRLLFPPISLARPGLQRILLAGRRRFPMD